MAELDITSSVANFREAARHLWNAHYRPTLDKADVWDIRDSFDGVICKLFQSLILEPLDIRGTALAPSKISEPGTVRGLVVRPRSVSGVPILINRDRPPSGYWDHPKKQIVSGEADLLFARFFDFDQLGVRDFRYLEVLVASSSQDQDIAGRWALLDFEYAAVYANAGPEAGWPIETRSTSSR